MLRPKVLGSIFVLAVLTGMVFGEQSSWAAAARQNFGSGLVVCAPPIQPVVLQNPNTITNCTQAGIQAALNTGGEINFNCGPAPVTIAISSELRLSTQTDTLLDGGGLVTLDGQGLTRILLKTGIIQFRLVRSLSHSKICG